MRALVDEGVNIIIDDIILEPDFLTDYLDVFKGCEAWFVGVRCDLAIIEEREQAAENSANSDLPNFHKSSIQTAGAPKG